MEEWHILHPTVQGQSGPGPPHPHQQSLPSIDYSHVGGVKWELTWERSEFLIWNCHLSLPENSRARVSQSLLPSVPLYPKSSPPVNLTEFWCWGGSVLSLIIALRVGMHKWRQIKVATTAAPETELKPCSPAPERCREPSDREMLQQTQLVLNGCSPCAVTALRETSFLHSLPCPPPMPATQSTFNVYGKQTGSPGALCLPVSAHEWLPLKSLTTPPPLSNQKG